MAALMGNHYCYTHQGNHSHYAPHNCELCQALERIDALRIEIVLLKGQIGMEKAASEIDMEQAMGIFSDTGSGFEECPDCSTRYLKSQSKYCPLCWPKGME